MSKFVTVWMLFLQVSFLGRCEIAITPENIVRSADAAATNVNESAPIQDLKEAVPAEQEASQQSLVIDVDAKAEIGGVVFPSLRKRSPSPPTHRTSCES